MIADRYTPAFESLTPPEVHVIVECLAPAHPELYELGDFEEGRTLLDYCRASGISHAEVIMSMARDIRPHAVLAVERICMRPIDRRSPAQVEREREAANPRPVVAPVRPSATHEEDERTITVLATTCPKRAGTKSADLWRLYRTGQTITEYLRAGGTRAALQWDQERGFIRIDDASVSAPEKAETES